MSITSICSCGPYLAKPPPLNQLKLKLVQRWFNLQICCQRAKKKYDFFHYTTKWHLRVKCFGRAHRKTPWLILESNPGPSGYEAGALTPLTSWLSAHSFYWPTTGSKVGSVSKPPLLIPLVSMWSSGLVLFYWVIKVGLKKQNNSRRLGLGRDWGETTLT